MLEHTVIGGELLRRHGADLTTLRSWLVHDLHETEFVGDVPRPDKKRYMAFIYHSDVDAWDDRLADEVGLPIMWNRQRDVVGMDEAMVRAENATVAGGMDTDLRYDGTDPWQSGARMLIDTELFVRPVTDFWRLWDGQ